MVGTSKNSRSFFLAAIVMLSSVAHNGFSQRRTAAVQADDEKETYKSILSFGVTTTTNSGIIGGLVFRHSKMMASDFMDKPQLRYLSVEIVNVKSPIEYSSDNNIFFGGVNSIFNKRNYLFAIRPSYGREIELVSKRGEEGISVSAIAAVGPSIGLEKPFMVREQRNGRTVVEPFDPSKSTSVTSAGIFSGLGRSKIVPGAHAKLGFAFELSAFRNNITGVEVGFLADLYARKVNISTEDNTAFYPSGYLTLYFGTKK